MKKKQIGVALLAGLVLLSSLAPGLAALPPIHDRVEQFESVLATPGLADALSEHGLIDRIERTGDLIFRVFAGKCFATVSLTPVPLPEGMVGPTRYEGSIGPVTCD
jgi:hypothetical protein